MQCHGLGLQSSCNLPCVHQEDPPKKPKLGCTCQVLLPKSSACNGAFAGGLKEIFPMILLQVLLPKEPCGATALDFSRQDMSPALWFPSERGLTRLSHPGKSSATNHR